MHTSSFNVQKMDPTQNNVDNADEQTAFDGGIVQRGNVGVIDGNMVQHRNFGNNNTIQRGNAGAYS